MLSVIRGPWCLRVFLLMLVVMRVRAAHSQTTTFTYQGQLSDAGSLANGSYDLRFALLDSAEGGAQIGANQTVPAVPVSDGVFTVHLDFGVNAFPGANRFMEIAVKPAGVGSFTTLAPRQQISSSPYAIRTLSAATADALSSACVGCVLDTQIQAVAGSKVSGVIPVASVPAGSANYIQNTTTPQAGTNFNVGGNGSVGGMLGIGTSTPASKLAVQTATGLFGFTHTDGSITVGSYVGGSNSGATGGWLGTRSNHALHLFTNNGQPSLTIDTTGNVGIGTTAPSAGARLEVNGTLAATTVRATTQYDVADPSVVGDFPVFKRVLSAAGVSNLFVGLGAGQANDSGAGDGNTFVGAAAGEANTTGEKNAFVGAVAGQANTTGDGNTFVGALAGRTNMTGERNAFVGAAAGLANTTGGANAFLGAAAGQANTAGGGNAFVGFSAGEANTTGGVNAFFGLLAGASNTQGSENTFLGPAAGVANTTGSRNTIVGMEADVGANNLTNATAIGAKAQVDQSNALVLGSMAGVNGADASANVGIGTTTPQARLHVKGDTLVETSGSGGNIGLGTPNGETGMNIIKRVGTTSRADMRFDGSTLKLVASTGVVPPAATNGIAITTAGNVGIGTLTPDATLSVNGSASKTGGGSWTIFSDERLKTIKGRFTPGLNAVMQLQPVRYAYKPDNALGLRSSGEHIGFGAHAVQQVIPEAVSANDQGYLLVNNDPILWTMLNAVKEQQQEIEQLREAVRQLRVRRPCAHGSTRAATPKGAR